MCCLASDLRATLRIVGAIAMIAVLPSCGALSMDVPAPFLVLDDSTPYDLRITTPDDARIWVREFDDPDQGDAAFWADALDHDLLGRGYVQRGDAEEVRDAEGRVGRLRIYDVDADGREHGYLVAVFVRDRFVWGPLVRVAEFVAPRQRFDELLPTVRTALATLEP